jgi:tRNA (mo5U34)-methyltransferase
LHGGVQTFPDHPLGDFPSFKWAEIKEHIPKDLSNWRILDIGCNAGFYSFELAKRGGRVTAIDCDQHYLDQAIFLAELLGVSKSITFKKMQIYDIAAWSEKFDLIWFMGVFYHLLYPQLALDIISRHSENLLVFQSMTMPDSEMYKEKADVSLDERYLLCSKGWPKMAFVENTIEHDPTNWWVPNVSAVKAMLKECGFTVLSMPADEVIICKKTADIAKDDIREQEYRSATGLSREDGEQSSKC